MAAQPTWNPWRAMTYGGIAGAVYGVFQLVSGAGPKDPVFIYQLVFIGGTAGAGAVMFAIVAALRNLLVR
jgi:hypothetical protein